MKLADIERLIDSGESDTVEFKKSTGQLRRAFQTLCGFLNGHGGQVIIGVTSKGRITGQQVFDSTLEEIASHIAKLEPPASVMIHRIPLEGADERDLLVLGTDPGDATMPFTYDGRPYQRLGNTTVTDKNSLFGGPSIGKMELCIKGKKTATYGALGLLY